MIFMYYRYMSLVFVTILYYYSLFRGYKQDVCVQGYGSSPATANSPHATGSPPAPSPQQQSLDLSVSRLVLLLTHINRRLPYEITYV